MLGLTKLFQKIHRRFVWQTLGVYVAGCWLVLQIVDVLANNVGLPGWVFKAVLWLFALGLPVSVITAYQEGRRSRVEPAPPPEGTPLRFGVDASSAAAAAQPAPAAEPAADLRRRLFTWRNALLSGGGAFALLGVAAAGYMAMRTLGIGPAGTLVAKGVIDEAEPIVLADFADRIGDPSLAQGVTEALRIDLEQSPTVRLLGSSQLRAALRRMERPDTARITEETAREIAAREGLKAYLAGKVSRVGGATLISLDLVTPEDETLISLREAATDTTEILDAVDRLSKSFRERAGEPLRSVRRSPPLALFMTASLPALRLASEGARLWGEREYARAAELLRRAVAIDPSFPMAHAMLAFALRDGFSADRAAQVEAIARAFELRDRLPEARRLHLEGVYYNPMFRNEPERSLEAFEAAAALDSMDAGHSAWIGWVHRWLRNDERALAGFQRGLALDTLHPLFHTQVIRMLWNLERFEEADSLLAVMERRLPDATWTSVTKFDRHLVHREYAVAESVAAETGRTGWLRALAQLHGKLDDASRLREVRLEAAGHPPERVLFETRSDAVADVQAAGGDPGPWLARLDSLRSELPGDFSPLDVPNQYLLLAGSFAILRSPERARAMLEAFDEAMPKGFLGEHERFRFLAAGHIAIAEDRAGDAIQAFRAADVGYCLLCALPWLGRAYDLAGQPDSAIAVLERFVTTTSWDQGWLLEYPLAYERLGQLYDAKGDLENAAEHYARFVELWAEADPELQPRVRAAQARLEEILAERG